MLKETFPVIFKHRVLIQDLGRWTNLKTILLSILTLIELWKWHTNKVLNAISGGQEIGLQLDVRHSHGGHLANEARPAPNDGPANQSRRDSGLRTPLEGIMWLRPQQWSRSSRIQSSRQRGQSFFFASQTPAGRAGGVHASRLIALRAEHNKNPRQCPGTNFFFGFRVSFSAWIVPPKFFADKPSEVLWQLSETIETTVTVGIQRTKSRFASTRTHTLC